MRHNFNIILNFEFSKHVKKIIMFKVYECILEPSITKVNIFAKTWTHALFKLEDNGFETIFFLGHMDNCTCSTHLHMIIDEQFR